MHCYSCCSCFGSVLLLDEDSGLLRHDSHMYLCDRQSALHYAQFLIHISSVCLCCSCNIYCDRAVTAAHRANMYSRAFFILEKLSLSILLWLHNDFTNKKNSITFTKQQRVKIIIQNKFHSALAHHFKSAIRGCVQASRTCLPASHSFHASCCCTNHDTNNNNTHTQM